MCGNKHAWMMAAAVALLLAMAAQPALAGERKLPGRSFRFGLDVEPGYKLINGGGIQFNAGLVFKFNENISLIPHFGMYPYSYEMKTTYSYGPFSQTITDTLDETAINAGITLRMEMLTEVPAQNTYYEYDVEGQEFVHYKYYKPMRPYVQAHLGTFIGLGGGVNYYLTSAASIGLGADVGYNLQAKESKGLGFIPKAVITFGI